MGALCLLSSAVIRLRRQPATTTTTTTTTTEEPRQPTTEQQQQQQHDDDHNDEHDDDHDELRDDPYVDILLPRGCLYVQRNAVRYQYSHAIEAHATTNDATAVETMTNEATTTTTTTTDANAAEATRWYYFRCQPGDDFHELRDDLRDPHDPRDPERMIRRQRIRQQRRISLMIRDEKEPPTHGS